jgi:aldose sugar dehydrogenase
MLLLSLLLWTFAAPEPRTTHKVLDNFDIIWGFDFINDNELVLNEVNGKMWYVNLRTNQQNQIQNVPAVLRRGQGGLMDVRLHPQFSKNKLIYITYSYAEGNASHTRLARAKLENNALTNLQVLFTAGPLVASGQHYGSRIAFDGQGHVFVSIGERNVRDKAQDLDTHYGKVIRLNEDGSIPKDNPFVGQAGKKPEIWSYGHRNPQGLYYDRQTNQLWEAEHGPMGGDELNLVQKGKNYGWPLVSYGREYSGGIIGGGNPRREGVEDPKYYYIPSIATSSLHIYKGTKYPGWNNNFFIGGLALQHLSRLEMTNGQVTTVEPLFRNTYGRIRSVNQSPNGTLYFSTDGGELYEIR